MNGFIELGGISQDHAIRVLTTENGAAIRSLFVRDKDGKKIDVVQGYELPEDYLHNLPVLGAVVGRYAGRIAGARVNIQDAEFLLTENEGNNTLHGGRDFYHERKWELKNRTEHSVTYALHSPHLDQGMPGNADIEVTYSVTDHNVLRIHYEATADQDTYFNLTNHSYFNLDGHKSNDIARHKRLLSSTEYVEADAQNIPTGKLLATKGTALDFSEAHEIGERIDSEEETMRNGHGYDHCYALTAHDEEQPVATVWSEKSGIRMEVFTDSPAIVFYTENFLDVRERAKENAVYERRSSFCLETGFFPDTPHQTQFPSALFEAGRKYSYTTIYRFSKI